MVEHETDTGSGLVDEIRRYLAVVDAFRALGAEPTWMSEALLGWSEGRMAAPLPLTLASGSRSLEGGQTP